MLIFAKDEYALGFELVDPFKVTTYTPENIFNCLAKIGAFIALARVFVIFSIYHEYRFEKKL